MARRRRLPAERDIYEDETPGEQEEPEPTPHDIAKACRGKLSDADCREIADMDLEDALSYAFTALNNKDVDDPAAFLKKRGVFI